jgi:hypothetical protein
MLNVNTLATDINAALKRADEQLKAAARANGVKPRLDEARACLLQAADALRAVTELIIQAEARYIYQPPDVIASVNVLNQCILLAYREIDMYEQIMAKRTPMSKTLRPEQVN